jgi:predicted metalloprotease
MRWEDEPESTNVEDARGGGFSIGGRGAGIGCGGLLLLLLVAWLTGINPVKLLDMVNGSSPSASTAPANPSQSAPAPAPSDQLGKFASVVLASTENVWTDIFARSGRTYEKPTLVLFSGGMRSACGIASTATGPFYCQLDRKVYLDLSFFQELSRRFGAPGEFADAYVIAHEVGHHVQNQLGLFDRVSRDSRSASVPVELQADCYAGVWGYHANKDRHMIEPGDFDAGLRAASAIGDDRLQKMSQGYVSPDSFTHGSSSERSGWLRRGLETGDPAQCDTFRGQLQ